jgi:hypothetical protein
MEPGENALRRPRVPKNGDKASHQLETMLRISRLLSPPPYGSRIDIQQFGDLGLVDTWQALLKLLKKAAAVCIGSPYELIECVTNDVAHTLDSDQSCLEPIKITGGCVHGGAYVDKGGVQGRPLLVAEVGGLELRLQVGESFANLGKPLVRRAVYLGVPSDFVESPLECGLDPLDLGVDLDQPAALGVLGDSRGQAVSFLSV